MPLDGTGKLRSGDPGASRHLLDALDWDGRMGLSKKPAQPPHEKSLPIEHLRWNLFTNVESTLNAVAEEHKKGAQFG